MRKGIMRKKQGDGPRRMAEDCNKKLLKISACLLAVFVSFGASQFGWQQRDSFDEVKTKYDMVTDKNCLLKAREMLYLGAETVTHKPDIKDININPILPNR
jgi:hypothetical protein